MAKVLLFGDGTVDPVSTLRELFRDAKRSPLLAAFLRSSAFALRTELAQSTSPARKVFPTFHSINELAEWYSTLSRPQVAICPVLLNIAQVGVLLREYELNPDVLVATESTPLYCIGLCNGMISAAAAASARSSTDIIAVGIQLALVNLRLVLAGVDRSRAIEDSDGDWTIITPGIDSADHERFIETFVSNEGSMPITRRPYVSAEAEKVSTVSGPPSVLSRYLDSTEVLQKAKKIPTPINAAFHASHIPIANVEAILGTDFDWAAYAIKDNVKFFSIDTGKPSQASNLRLLLLEAVNEILNRRFRWGTVLLELCADLKTACTGANILAIGPDRVATAVQKEVQNVGLQATIASPSSATGIETLPRFDDIAIVGISSRLPGGGDDLDQIWELLHKGHDTHGRVPSDRFSLDDHFDPSGSQPNTTPVPFGCFVDRPGAFDARMFNMSPREAKQTDPMQRLALLTTYEALEMAGYSPNARPSFASERIATFFGQTLDDYRETNACQEVDIYYVTGGVRAFGPGRMNYHFKWEGPSMSVDTACSSSALAIHLAFSSLRSGECDMAVAGGANIITGSDMFAGLGKGGFLSKTGNCKTFDDGADGYCRAEGVGSVVLKRLQDAQADHDDIFAVIKSCSTNHSANAASITRPHAGAQVKVMHRVLHDAGIEPSEVDYVEMHGTGTQAGDATELSAVSQVFTPNRTKENPLHVGSVKSNFGHGEAIAGFNSILKAVLMLRHHSIPPHVGIKTKMNTKFSADEIANITINKSSKPFPRDGSKPRRVVVNSFNATGGNTAILIEDPPVKPERRANLRSTHVVAVSGHTAKSFTGNKRRLLQYLRDNPGLKIEDVAYTTTARRMHHSIRATYTAENIGDLVKAMARDADDESKATQGLGERKNVFVLTGQGSHSLAEAQKLFKTSPIFREKLMNYDNICRNQGLPSFIGLIDASVNAKESTQAQWQLSAVAIQLTFVAMLKSWGVMPDAVVGHSIGEYVALVAAGCLSESDVLHLIGNRALMIDKTCEPDKFSMLSVSADLDTLEGALERTKPHGCQIACYNGPALFVVSGPQQDISRLTSQLQRLEVTHRAVDVKFGFHSSQMKPIGESLRSLCQSVSFLPPRIPIASTLLGRVVENADTFDGSYLASHTVEPVRFSDAVTQLAEHLGAKDDLTWLEIGTHPNCGTMIASTLQVPSNRALYTLRRNEDAWMSISKSLARLYDRGFHIDWSEFHKDHYSSVSTIALPTYSFDLDDYWIPYNNSWRLNKTGVAAIPAPEQKPDPRLLPFHYLDSEEIQNDCVDVVLRCDLSDPQLLTMIHGHMIEGTGLCPSSVYAHLAFNAAAYILERVIKDPSAIPAVDLRDVDIISPLKVSKEDVPPNLTVKASRSSDNQDAIYVEFMTKSGQEETMHCRCALWVGDSSHWGSQLKEVEYLLQSQIDQLTTQGQRPVTTMYRDMLYKLFASAIVDYGEPYQLIQRIHIDYTRNEAVAELEIPSHSEVKHGSPGPYCLDSLMHMAGFVLNTNPAFTSDTVFIASGWANLQFVEPLQAGHSYSCYTRMFADDTQSGLYRGNVSVFSGGQTVAICRGLKFHQLKRRSLQRLLDVHKSASTPLARQPEVKPVPNAEQQDSAKSSHSEKKQATEETDVFPGILEDIATEVRVKTTDLQESTRLSELGIDSLLSISLLDRFKSRTGSSLPANTFSVCATIGALKEFICEKQRSQAPTPPEQPTKAKPTQGSARDTPRQNPATRHQKTPTETHTGSQPQSEILFEVIAEEIGTDSNDVKQASTVNGLGIDSILMISIGNQFKDKTGRDLGAKFFYDHPTINSIIKTLDGDLPEASDLDTSVTDADDAVAESSNSNSSASGEEYDSSVSTPLSTPPPKPLPSCVSMLLQGDQNSDKPALFFLPDGSGSLFSYVHIPDLKPDLAVYAFDSPFHRNPEDFTISFAAVASIYVDEIRRIQPHGPYMIGGWSLGGVHAYEVSRRLIEAGERVDRLIMMDSPCPGTLPPLPEASLDLLEKAGIFEALKKEGGSVAEHTRLHFVRITDSFQHWDRRSLYESEKERLGTVSIIWAQHGVLEDADPVEEDTSQMTEVEADMLKAREWLTGKRTSFDAGGWDELVGKEVQCFSVPGNHFSMMFPPVVSHLVPILRQIL